MSLLDYLPEAYTPNWWLLVAYVAAGLYLAGYDSCVAGFNNRSMASRLFWGCFMLAVWPVFLAMLAGAYLYLRAVMPPPTRSEIVKQFEQELKKLDEEE